MVFLFRRSSNLKPSADMSIDDQELKERTIDRIKNDTNTPSYTNDKTILWYLLER